MSIHTSLNLTPPETYIENPEGTSLAWGRGVVPVAWWFLFSKEDVIAGPDGPMLRCRASQALARLETCSLVLRAAAGRQALGLRTIAQILAEHPDHWVEAHITEAYHRASFETLRRCIPTTNPTTQHDLTTAVNETRWVYQQHNRLVRSYTTPTLALANYVVGWTKHRKLPLPDDAELTNGCTLALATGDLHKLDLLEEALYRRLEPDLAPYLTFIPSNWNPKKTFSNSTKLRQSYQAWLDDKPDPFASLTEHDAWPFIKTIKSLPPPPRSKRRLLLQRGATEPFEALIAFSKNNGHPAASNLLLADWSQGGPPPWLSPTQEGVLACRLAATGAPSSPLSLFDPLAIAERMAANRFLLGSELDCEGPWHIAVSRALILSQKLATQWNNALSNWHSKSLEPELFSTCLSQKLCDLLARKRLAPDRLKTLRSLPKPDTPALKGPDRSMVQLALGELSLLENLLKDPDAKKDILVDAIDAADVAAQCLPWLEALVHTESHLEKATVSAAVLVVLCKGIDARISHLVAKLPEAVGAYLEHWSMGLITTQERDSFCDHVKKLRDALATRGASDALLARLNASLE